MSFGMETWNRNMQKNRNRVTRIQIAKYINVYIAGDAETRFHTSNNKLARSLPKIENKKVNWLKINNGVGRKNNDKNLLH